jgi:hypothetical protein
MDLFQGNKVCYGEVCYADLFPRHEFGRIPRYHFDGLSSMPSILALSVRRTGIARTHSIAAVNRAARSGRPVPYINGH